MRIVSFVNGNSGPSFHRVILPLLSMPDLDCFITNNLLEEHFEKGCDIFYYNRTIPEHAAATVEKLKEKYGFKICVDLDDFWELDPHHILYDNYQEIEYSKQAIKHISNADVVFTTHDRLALEILPYNKQVHVLPNAIPHQGQFAIERKPYHLTRLFWQGSDTHKADINLLQRPMELLNGIAGKIKMIMAGYAEDHPEWYKMVMDYTAMLKHQYKLIPFTKVYEYYKAYEEADICLIPLLNTPFNRFKSNLKVLEAANLSLPVICSEVHPYIDLPVLYAKGTGDWIKHITRLVGSKKRQKECGQELKEYVDKHFCFEKINRERRQILEHVSKSVNV